MSNKFIFNKSLGVFFTIFSCLFIINNITKGVETYGKLRAINKTKYNIWIQDIGLTGVSCYGDKNPSMFHPLKPGEDQEEQWTGWCYFGYGGSPTPVTFYISKIENDSLENAIKNNRKIDASFEIDTKINQQQFYTITENWKPFETEDIATGAKTTPVIKISYATNFTEGWVAQYAVTIAEMGTEALIKPTDPTKLSPEALKNLKYDNNYVNVENKTKEVFTVDINNKDVGNTKPDSPLRVLVADKDQNLVFKLKHDDLAIFPEIAVPKKLIGTKQWTEIVPAKTPNTSYQLNATIAPVYLISEKAPQNSSIEYQLVINQLIPIRKGAEVSKPNIVESAISYDPNDYRFKNESEYAITVTLTDIDKPFVIAAGQSLEIKQTSIKPKEQGNAKVNFTVTFDNSEKYADSFAKDIKQKISLLSAVTHDNGKKSSNVSVEITPGYYETKMLLSSEWKVNYTIAIKILDTRSIK